MNKLYIFGIVSLFSLTLIAMQQEAVCILCDKTELGDLETVRTLDPNRNNPVRLIIGLNRGKTPLYIAASYGHLPIVQYYVEELDKRGEDINPPKTLPPEHGVTPLAVAASWGRSEVVKYYIQKLAGKGENINPLITQGYYYGSTPFDLAIRENRLEAVRLFVHRGIMVDPESEDLQNEHAEIANYLRKIAPLTHKLLKKGLEVRQQITGSQREADISYIMRRIYTLIKKGAEVEAQGDEGYTLLHCLIGSKNRKETIEADECVRTLIGNDKKNIMQKISAIFKLGNTIDKSLFINALTDSGDTAMSLASRYGNTRMVKYLLKQGANPTVGNNFIQVALEKNQFQVLRALFMALPEDANTKQGEVRLQNGDQEIIPYKRRKQS